MSRISTMQERYGVDYGLQSEELKRKQINTMIDKYGVGNIQKIPEFSAKARMTQRANWNKKVQSEFPLKLIPKETAPCFWFDESDMQIFFLKDKASVEFLRCQGHQVCPKFGKKHLSVGLADNGILYQVLRFEEHKGEICLTNFGTRHHYFNPNYYSKLLQEVTKVLELEEFTCAIPRTLAVPELVQSLSIELVSYGTYEVYWVTEDGLKRLTNRHNISEMKSRYDYVTSDYLDLYRFNNKAVQ